MKKLLFYGGTFDPPHSGHWHLLKQASKSFCFDKIVVMPTALPPHKDAAHFLSDEQRLKAVSMLFSSIHGVVVSDWEIVKGGKSYSIETIEYLKEQYPEYEVYFLMGSDMFLGFEKWYRFEDIAKLCTLVTAPRTKEDVTLLNPAAAFYKQKYGLESIVLRTPIVDKSSTEIRGGASDHKLPLEVQYYLYGKSALSFLEDYLKKNLTVEKYEHSYRVAEYATELAKIHNVDENSVFLAALLHDATKCWGKKRQLAYLQKKRYKLSVYDKQAPQIFHQISGSLYAAEHFYVKDKGILQAIKCHTTGRENMTPLDKLLFLTDSIEPARRYDGVELMRETAKVDLDKAVLMNLDRSIKYIVEKGFFLHPQTVAARNWMLKSIIPEEKYDKSK